MTLKDTTFDPAPVIPPFKAVVFDLDDTLYPEQQYALSGFHAAANYVNTLYDIDIYDDLVKRFLAGERTNIFGATLARHFKYVEEDLIRKIMYVYWSHNPRIEMYADARVCLALLISKGVRIGLVTAGQSSIQRKKVAALELEPLMDSIVYSDDLLGPKQPCQPCEDAFHITALQFDLELSEMIFVGDNPLVDFSIPRKLGMGTVLIRRKHGEHLFDTPPSPSHAPDVAVSSMEMIAGVYNPAGSNS